MPAFPSKKLLFVDDDPAMHDGMRFMLNEYYELTCVFSGKDAVTAVASDGFSVVILDLQMKGISGLETLRKMGSTSIAPKVIILTGHDSKESAIAAVNLGAFRYLVKPIHRGELLECLDAAFLRFEFESKVIPKSKPASLSGLSERQKEIVMLVVQGESNREIGARLTITPRTVEKHMQQIFSALNVSSRAKLTALVSQV